MSSATSGQLSNRERTRRAFLSLLPKQSVGAEVGVSTGAFSEVILELVDPRELVLIDPWDLLAEKLAGTADEDKWFADAKGMGKLHARVVELFNENSAVNVVRGFSQDCLGGFGDGHFDWVYLDAHHRYDDVLQELKLSAKAVKVGGLITGDDLFKKHNGRSEVAMAVKDFLNANGESADFKVLDRDNLPKAVNQPSRVGQQFILPVTEAMKIG